MLPRNGPGVRQRAALHLQWEDVDLEAGVVTWRAQYDKVGREWSQPIRDATRSALLTALYWRERDGYTGPWVFYSSWSSKAKGREAPGVFGAQGLWKALRNAEVAAGVPSLPLRSAHGLRRMVAGEVLRETGDLVLATHFIGDTDFRVMQRYLKRRDDRLEAVAKQLDKAHKPTPKPQPHRNAETPPEESGAEVLVSAGVAESHRSESNRRPLDYESRALPLSYGGGECPGPDSNRDGSRHCPLKTACLPIPPPGQAPGVARREQANRGRDHATTPTGAGSTALPHLQSRGVDG